jgi:hypothetical protein
MILAPACIQGENRFHWDYSGNVLERMELAYQHAAGHISTAMGSTEYWCGISELDAN